MSRHSLICASVITRGGANLMMSPCVGLANKPLPRSFMHTSYASYSERNTNHSAQNSIITVWEIVSCPRMQYIYIKAITIWTKTAIYQFILLFGTHNSLCIAEVFLELFLILHFWTICGMQTLQSKDRKQGICLSVCQRKITTGRLCSKIGPHFKMPTGLKDWAHVTAIF